MAYSVEFEKSAAKYIQALDAPTRQRFREKIGAIQADPFDATHSKPLKARTERSARIGDFRILFEVDQENEIVHIVHAGPRGQVYR